jgi:Domain of unknown function (DUF892)
VSLSRFFGVISGMDGMTACGVSMMCRFLVMPTVVMLRCFFVVSGSVGVMLGSLPMMLSAIMGIIEEGQEVMKEFRGAPALDAGLLAAAQAVEHYEIARYGTLKVWNRLWLELLVIWRVRTPIGDANAKPLFCVVVSSGPIWVADAECNGASIDAVDGRERVCSLRGAS